MMTFLMWAAFALAAEEPEPFELRNTNAWFLTGEVVTSVVVGFMVPDLFFPHRPEVVTCDIAWCNTNGFDRAMNRAFLMPNRRVAATASHTFTIGLTPAIAFTSAIVPAALNGKPGHAVQDSIIILDAFVLATGFNSIAKVGARRQRPAFYYDRAHLTEADGHAREEFVSFYSGDTTWAFALASSASTLAALRGYRHWHWVAVGSGALALTGSLLRMSSDMHWATDVLVGAVTGTAVGIALPLSLHGRKNKEVDLALVPLGMRGLQLTGRW